MVGTNLPSVQKNNGDNNNSNSSQYAYNYSSYRACEKVICN